MPKVSSSKGKIALVKIATDRVIHPIGFLYLANALKKAGYEAKIFHIYKNEIDATIDAIIELKPLFVGFSTLTGPETRYTYDMAEALRGRNKDIRIVWGGVHPTILPEECLREECVDMVCLGEGEETIVELADSIALGKDPRGIKSVGYKSSGKVVINPRRHYVENLDIYEPDWSAMDDFERCVSILPDGRRHTPFISSRGCPFNCNFCYNLVFHKSVWRRHSLEFVIDKISNLKERYGIRAVTFYDDNFFVDMDRSFRILEKMKEMDILVASCLMRLDSLNEDVLKRLKRLNIKRLFLGAESGNDRVLKLINKGLNRNIILEKFELLSKFPEISPTAAFIIGFPTESWEEMGDTIDMGVKVSEMVPNVVVTYQTFLPYPGSHLYDIAMKNGFSPPKSIRDYDMFDTFRGQIDPTWLSWADKNTKKMFYRIDKYGKLLTHSKADTALRSLGKEFLYRLSKARLKNRFFAFPWEIMILHRFNRYYNPNCPV